MSRSLRVAPGYIKQVKFALERKFWNQSHLVENIGLSRSTISKFFTGGPVNRVYFLKICQQLGLDWQEIANIEDGNTSRETGQHSYPLEAQPEEKFIEATKNWDLKRLSADLEVAKREGGANKRWGLTTVEKQYLRGLLCGYSPDEVAAELDKDVNLVQVQLSKSLYRYVEKLLDRLPNSLENWRDIVIWLAEAGYRLDAQSVDIHALVQEVREKVKPTIQERCGTIRVLDMTQPIGLNDIYTNVNILEKITGRRRKEIAELLQEGDSEDFERFGLGEIAETRVPGLEVVKKYTKLMILGKPGAGKTTFLKYVAMQCVAGNFQADRVPVFVSLKDFAEAANRPGLLEYICQQCSSGSADTQNFASMQEVIAHGRALILLDSLDEIRENDSQRVLKEIRDFSAQYSDNHFVMTCRIAAWEYTFDKFTDVEVADFDEQQIATFASNWFKSKVVKSETFLKRIEDNRRIRELATNPLLLTLLCLVFEESGDFPANRSELYKEGLDALLKKWDAKRGIERFQIYKKLSVQRKEDLLSKIALTTFEQGDYFFKQKAAEYYITEYIRNLPDANTDPDALQLDSEKVLQSIEAQHGLLVERAKGIYSFSHSIFHEYFTAREIIVCRQSSEEALQNLVSHITERRWQEVFLLAVGMSPSADRLLLLMKKQVDSLVEDEQKLQDFLIWVKEKSDSADVPDKSAAVRAFYFSRARDRAPLVSLNCALALDHVIGLNLNLDLNLDLDLDRNLYHALGLTLDRDLELDLTTDSPDLSDYTKILTTKHTHDLDRDLKCALERALDLKLKKALQELKEQLPGLNGAAKIIKQWWKDNSRAWAEELRAVMIKYRNIGHDWQFSEQQKELLQRYYDANLLLVNCLKSDCYVSREVRQEIEDTLLLPIADIEKPRHPA